MLEHHKGHRQHDRRAVDDHRDPAFEQLRRRDVRLFGRADLLEQRAVVVLEPSGDIRRLDYAVDVDRVYLALRLGDDLGIGDSVDVDDTDRSAAQPPYLFDF